MINGRDILKKRKEQGLSSRELAIMLGVKVANLYKWQKGIKPQDPEDYIKVENWLNGKLEFVPHETAVEEKPPSQSVREPAPQYGRSIRLLEEMVELLKKQNGYLQEQVNASLKALAASQDILLAHSKASLDWEASKFGKNQAQIDKVRFELSKLVHEHLKALKEEGTTIGMGK